MGWVKSGFVFVVFVGSCFGSLEAFACEPGMEVPGEFLVRFQAQSAKGVLAKGQSDPASLLAAKGIPFEVIHSGKPLGKSSLGLSKAQLNSPRPSLYHLKNVTENADQISSLPGALSVEPNCWIRPMIAPNDPDYADMWAHGVMESEKAWDISTGSTEIIVAVSDTGVDYRHQDLKDQMWVNTVEQQGTRGVDDDNNGCVDDIYGCDFADDDGDPKPATSSGGEHGTHVAGIIGAAGNNGLGVTGLNWNIKIMAIKGFSDSTEFAKTADLLKTVYYAADNGAQVLNCSWGANQRPTSAERDAFKYAQDKGLVVVVAAGNSASNSREFSPAAISGLITVASSNSRDRLSSFSNYGTVVDVMAPGGDAPRYGGRDEKILSTVPNNGYEGLRGTSMAAPYVAGLAGLILSINPKLSPGEVEDLMENTADVFTVGVPKNSNLEYKYKRINARKAAEAALASVPKPDPDPVCSPGQQCSQDGGNAGNITSGDVSRAITSGFSGCGNEMKPRSNNASLPFAFIALPLLLLMALRQRRK